jgi:hypothetical protein
MTQRSPSLKIWKRRYIFGRLTPQIGKYDVRINPIRVKQGVKIPTVFTWRGIRTKDGLL